MRLQMGAGERRRAETDYIDVLLAEAGINYRQFHHWRTKGWLGPELAERQGSGAWLSFTDDQREYIIAIGREYNALVARLDEIRSGARWAELEAARPTEYLTRPAGM